MNPAAPFRPAFTRILVATLAIVSWPHVRSSEAQTIINAHVSTGGVQGNATADINGHAAISDDGVYVAFVSYATNLVAGDTNGFADVFVHNNLTGVTVLISLDMAGGPANESSFRPWISSTGRYVVFQSSATDLVPGDLNAMPDVFRRDRDTDGDGIFDEPGATTTILASVSTGGAQGNGPSRCFLQTVSDDGNRIAFESDATNLVPMDTNGTTDCFVRDVSAGTTVRVSVSTAGVQSNCSTTAPAISGNGLVAAFTANTFGICNLDPGDGSGIDVYVRNIAAGTTTLVSVPSGGATSSGNNEAPSISDDGDRVAFLSDATNLVAGDTNGQQDVFVRIISSGTTVRASVRSGGAQSLGFAYGAAISGDGNVVAFTSSNIDPAFDTNNVQDVCVHDLGSGTTARASRTPAGGQSNGRSYLAFLSEDGSQVAFMSQATNLVAPDANGTTLDVFVRGQPFAPPEFSPLPPPPPGALDAYPVTFSVNGPVDPHTEGIRDARGAPASPQVPVQPGNGTGFGIRAGPVPQAAGLASPRPGDVFDYGVVPLPSEAVVFQSAPPKNRVPPDGTNNQIIEALGSGLVAGPGVAPALWTSIPPDAPARDNIDALSFGEDYFPPGIEVGLDPASTLPDPPAGVGFMTWEGRTPDVVPAYKQPMVLADGSGIAFRFSVDPWAIGTPGTAVRTESGGVDVGAGLGPWTSGGDAAGDVFNTPLLTRVGGATFGATGNGLVHDNPALALAPSPPPLAPMEDDLDALECVGTNTSWSGVWAANSGSVHQRVIDVGPDLPPPGASRHEPNNDAPIFFSVTRSSVGAPFSAVRSQFVVDGGAAGDIFVMVKDPADPAGEGLNLLFIDEAELGLLAIDAGPGLPLPADYTDDLDALILRVCPEIRPMILYTIGNIVTNKPWAPYGFGDAYTGLGMTLSITKYLTGLIPPGCIQVGFSVTTDAVGLAYTGVDWEAGPVAPPGGVSAAAGDIFYAEVTGAAANRNYLWYEEADLGLDPGSWVNGVAAGLGALPDNLDALDSVDSLVLVVSVPWESPKLPQGIGIELAPGLPNPLASGTLLRYRTAHEGRVRITVHDLSGRLVAKLVDRTEAAGPHTATWDARDEFGRRVPAGLYFARATFGNEVRTAKLIVRR